MGTGMRKMYATRLDNNEDILWLSEVRPELRDGEYKFPKNFRIGFDMYVPDIIGLKKEDGTKQVRLEVCEEETGLYITSEDKDSTGEIWLYNYKPELDTSSPKKIYKVTDDDDCPIHLSYSFFRYNKESYSEPENVRLVLMDSESERIQNLLSDQLDDSHEPETPFDIIVGQDDKAKAILSYRIDSDGTPVLEEHIVIDKRHSRLYQTYKCDYMTVETKQDMLKFVAEQIIDQQYDRPEIELLILK